MKNPVVWAWRSLRERGLRRTLTVLGNFFDNWWFDIRHGTNTAPVVEPECLDVDSSNRRHSNEYRASKARPLRKLLESCQFPPESTFVDFGCGKGKVLVIAAEIGFKNVVGIEFSSQLCAVARSNIAKVLGEVPSSTIDIVHGDVVQYEFSGRENVLYFYNPFHRAVMEQVMHSVEQSLIEHPRPIWILYFAPECREVLDSQDFLQLTAHHILGGADHLIYENRLYRNPILAPIGQAGQDRFESFAVGN